MNIDTRINKLQDRLEQVEKNLSFMDVVGEEITKTTFHFRARQFVDSLIRQRQLIIDRGASHKNAYEMLKAIDHLRVNLDAIGHKDRPMARYFIMNEDEIRSLIPGIYPNKQYDKFIFLKDQAREINQRQLPLL